MKKLIINADDFGFSPAVNNAIVDCATSGKITATSLMVNMPHAEDAAKNINEKLNKLSLGLHFTLTSGKPVTKPEKVNLLVNSHGNFQYGYMGLAAKLKSHQHRDFLNQIQIEFFAQMELMDFLVAKYKLQFDHIDSHQHVHSISGLFEFVASEAIRRNLFLRFPQENFGDRKRLQRRFRQWLPTGFLKRAILNWNLRNARGQHSSSKNIVYFGILDSGRIDDDALSEMIRVIAATRDDNKFYEINIHPSDLTAVTNHKTFDENKNDKQIFCSKNDLSFHYSTWRTKELQTLQNLDPNELLKNHNIKLAGFSDID
ncbi:MAG: ChbG/HpnK family deacetylase [Planctomycetaceae bacterium]|jgi:predicted glycoside hydrolase/deacetylase ChbG (UPF0249 family)|nr:ChbG/HpnK family deacetylase [Planctomycetaceae bacterium]